MTKHLTIIGDGESKSHVLIDIAIDSASQGNSVLYQTTGRELAYETLRAAADRAKAKFPDQVERVVYTNGKYSVHLKSGGRIWFQCASRQGGRISVHTHIIDDCNGEFSPTAEYCVRSSRR